jgi:signal peptidase I
MRNLPRLHNRLLTVGAILGALCLLVALVGIVLGAKPLVFRSGSMSPTIPTGSLGISLPVGAAEIGTGDVISVENTTGVRITHRVVSTKTSGGTAIVTLRGDANEFADSEPYVLSKADRLVLAVPVLGYVVAWLSSPAAMFVGGLFTAFLLYLAFGSARSRRPEGSRRPEDGSEDSGRPSASESRPTPGKGGRRSKRMAATTVTSLALAAAGGLHTSVPVHAAFLDTATASASISAATLQPPVLACVNSGISDVILTLTHPGDFGTGYELKSSPPNRTWTPPSASWAAGAIVPITIDADDPLITHSMVRNVTFTAGSKISQWSSAVNSRVVLYSPAVGPVPASLRCIS